MFGSANIVFESWNLVRELEHRAVMNLAGDTFLLLGVGCVKSASSGAAARFALEEGGTGDVVRE